jgi:hypothetical protein
MRAKGQYFDDGEGIVEFPDQTLLVERDGDIVRIETSSGRDDYYSLGEPGVVLEMSLDDAIDLMARLSEVTMP